MFSTRFVLVIVTVSCLRAQAQDPEVVPRARVITTVAANPLAIQPQGIGLDSASNQIYVANFLSNDITVIDGATNLVTATLADPNAISPYAVGTDRVTHRVFIANSGPSNVTVLGGAQ